eukprot:1706095-Pyramimonas_sp.AAC.1
MAAMGACDSSHWGRQWGPRRGREPREGRAEIGAAGGARTQPLGQSAEIPAGPRSARAGRAEMGALGARERSKLG